MFSATPAWRIPIARTVIHQTLTPVRVSMGLTPSLIGVNAVENPGLTPWKSGVNAVDISALTPTREPEGTSLYPLEASVLVLPNSNFPQLGTENFSSFFVR